MMKEPISLDTALQIVGSLKVRAIKEKSTLTNLVEKDALDQKIKMYLKEEKMLYGTDDMARLSVMDKVVKQMNGVL